MGRTDGCTFDGLRDPLTSAGCAAVGDGVLIASTDGTPMQVLDRAVSRWYWGSAQPRGPWRNPGGRFPPPPGLESPGVALRCGDLSRNGAQCLGRVPSIHTGPP